MSKEHESIDYITEDALIGRIIYEALSLSNEIKATRVDYNQVIIKVKDTTKSKRLILNLLDQFKREPVTINTKRYVLENKKRKDLEISIKTNDDFVKYISTKSYAYDKFDKIISEITLLLGEPLEDKVHDFLVQIGYMEEGNSIHEPTRLNATFVKALEYIEDRNEYLVFVDYLWTSNVGSLFGFNFNKIENIWDHKSFWLQSNK